jgi:hypothetical protein
MSKSSTQCSTTGLCSRGAGTNSYIRATVRSSMLRDGQLHKLAVVRARDPREAHVRIFFKKFCDRVCMAPVKPGGVERFVASTSDGGDDSHVRFVTVAPSNFSKAIFVKG